VVRDQPGYEPVPTTPLAERMARGGTLLRVLTDAAGQARVALPALDQVEYLHHTIQLVVRFNADRDDPGFRPAQTPQFEFYTLQTY